MAQVVRVEFQVKKNSARISARKILVHISVIEFDILGMLKFFSGRDRSRQQNVRNEIHHARHAAKFFGLLPVTVTGNRDR